MRRLGILFLWASSALLAADSAAPGGSAATQTAQPLPSPNGPSAQTRVPPPPPKPAAAQGAKPAGAKPKSAQGSPSGPSVAATGAAAAKSAQPPVPIPPRFLQVREELAEIYPNADSLPVIWDDAHDPFRFGYGADEDGDTPGGAASGAGASADGKPASAPKMDLDTASLLEAGLDMMGGKAKKPAADSDAAPEKAFIPLTDAELLKRGVGKLRVGGVVVVRGVPRIMIDGVPRKLGDVITVSVSGKQAKIRLIKLGDNTVEFLLQGTKAKPPTLEITF